MIANAIINSYNSDKRIINTSKNTVNPKTKDNNQLFSYGPFLSISSGSIPNTTIITNSTILVNCHKK